MQEYLRPDLSQILPRPWVRQIAERAQAFAPLRPVPEVAHGDDFLVDVDRRSAPAADEPGFDLHNAQAVALRVKTALLRGAAAQPLHHFDAERLLHLRLPD